MPSLRTSCWRRKPALTASFRGRAQAEAKARSWAGHVSADVQTLIFRVVLIEMPKRFVPWNCTGISGLRRWCVMHPLCTRVDAIRSHKYRSRRAHARIPCVAFFFLISAQLLVVKVRASPPSASRRRGGFACPTRSCRDAASMSCVLMFIRACIARYRQMSTVTELVCRHCEPRAGARNRL